MSKSLGVDGLASSLLLSASLCAGSLAAAQDGGAAGDSAVSAASSGADGGAAGDTAAGAGAGAWDAAPAGAMSDGAAAGSTAAASTSGRHGLLGPLRIGPTVSLGFPFLLNYGVDATWDGRFGAAFSGGKLQRDIDDDSAVEVFNWDLRGRWFPWQGSFFVGAAYGNQGIVGKTKTDLKVKTADVELKVPTTLRLEVETTYLTPHLGWFATWDSGFTIGFEIGYQMPLDSKSELQTAFDDVSASAEASVRASAEYKKAKKDVEDQAAMFGEKAVPYVNLIRLGWLL